MAAERYPVPRYASRGVFLTMTLLLPNTHTSILDMLSRPFQQIQSQQAQIFDLQAQLQKARVGDASHSLDSDSNSKTTKRELR